jgi:hypothetical protein
MPCCFCFRALLLVLIALLLLPHHRVLLLAIFKYLLPPHCFFITLFAFVPFCYAWLVGTPSSLFYACGGAWSYTNMLHPTIEGLFSPPKFLILFLLLWILFVYFVFVCHFCFELNNFVLV